MQRSFVDRLISTTGLVLALVLMVASVGLLYAHNFIHSQVYEQLAAQRIDFPAENSPALTNLPPSDREQVEKYAGKQLTTGAQAAVFANHYINAHLKASGEGKTYSELSAELKINPSNTELSKKVDTAFRGETLRGMLLNAYAFDTMASIARVAAFAAAAGAVILLILSYLGFRHANVSSATKSSKGRKKR